MSNGFFFTMVVTHPILLVTNVATWSIYYNSIPNNARREHFHVNWTTLYPFFWGGGGVWSVPNIPPLVRLNQNKSTRATLLRMHNNAVHTRCKKTKGIASKRHSCECTITRCTRGVLAILCLGWDEAKARCTSGKIQPPPLLERKKNKAVLFARVSCGCRDDEYKIDLLEMKRFHK